MNLFRKKQPLTYQDIKQASTKELKDYLKQGIASVEIEDMISYELFEIRENF
tara:strand:+ start:68 stop:223 length:156 start_codon:yes stop_codon:yes gene_type:complete